MTAPLEAKELAMHARVPAEDRPWRWQCRAAVAEPLEQRQLFSATVSSLTLINADTDQPVAGLSLVQGATMDLVPYHCRL